jgi:hypothetical protein
MTTTEFETRVCFACRGAGASTDMTCQDAIAPGPFAGGTCTECRGAGVTSHNVAIVDVFTFTPSATDDDVPEWMC